MYRWWRWLKACASCDEQIVLMCFVITRTACHSVAVCCNLLADLCSLLPPACRLLSACYIHGGVHSCETGDAATQWWPETAPSMAAFSVRGMSCNPRTHTSIRPVLRPRAPQGPLMDGSMRDKKRETREKERERLWTCSGSQDSGHYEHVIMNNIISLKLALQHWMSRALRLCRS